MSTIEIVSTEGIPLDILRESIAELRPAFDLDFSDREFVIRTAQPPSWVTFLAEADVWIKALTAYAALYVAELVKEAGKDTWKNRGRVLGAMKAGGTSAIMKLASGIANIRRRVAPGTRLNLAIPIPSRLTPSEFVLSAKEPDELATEIASLATTCPPCKPSYDLRDSTPARFWGRSN